MRKQAPPILALIVVLLFGVPFLASPQTSSQTPEKSKTGKMSVAGQMNEMLKTKPLVPQGIDGGLWRTDHAFVSTLMLKNILVIAPIAVTPIIYMADGTEYDLPAVNLDAAGVAVLNINAALQGAPATIQSHMSSFGSAGIRYQWLWPGAVTAEVRNGDDARSLVYASHPHADIAKVNAPSAIQSQQTLEGMWWKQDDNTKCFVTLTNASTANIDAVVQVFDSGVNNTAAKNVTITPHSTQFLDLTSLWAQIPYTSEGGVRISYTAAPNALVIEGGLEDEVKGYSHPLRLGPVPSHPASSPLINSSAKNAGVSPGIDATTQDESPNGDTPQTVNLDSAGIMVGSQDPNMQFPQGTRFIPYMVLRNMTTAPIQIRLAANYSQGATPTDVSLGSITVAPQAIQQIDIGSILAANGLGSHNGYLNLRTSFFGFSSDLMEETGSLDQTKNYVFEVPPIMEGPSLGRIFSYWNSSGDTDSMISLWNYSGKDEDLVLTLYHQAGQYKLPVHLAANASVTIGIASLIRSGTPDADGNTLPMNTTQGSAKVSGPNMEKINVALHGAVFNVRTGTCCCICPVCCTVTTSFLVPGGVTVQIGTTTFEDPILIFIDGSCCDISLSMDWNTSSGNTSIATVDAYGYVTAIGVGDTYISGQSGNFYPTNTAPACEVFLSYAFCGPWLAIGLAAGIEVPPAVPVNFQQTSVSSNPANGFLTFTYTWQSSDGNLADILICNMRELVTYPGTPAAFVWSTPPYASLTTTPNPHTTGAFSAADLPATDTQKNFGFQTPYQANDFVATQIFQFQCPSYNSNAWTQIYPATGSLAIERTVSLVSGSTWKYVVTKSGASATLNPLP